MGLLCCVGRSASVFVQPVFQPVGDAHRLILPHVSDRMCGGIGALIAISAVVHRDTIRPRWCANAPGRYPPRRDVVCLQISPTVPWRSVSLAGRSPIVSAGKCTVRRAAPAGGSLQATIPTVDSSSPVHVGDESGQPVSDPYPPERHRHTVRTVFVQHTTVSAPSTFVDRRCQTTTACPACATPAASTVTSGSSKGHP